MEEYHRAEKSKCIQIDFQYTQSYESIMAKGK